MGSDISRPNYGIAQGPRGPRLVIVQRPEASAQDATPPPLPPKPAKNPPTGPASAAASAAGASDEWMRLIDDTLKNYTPESAVACDRKQVDDQAKPVDEKLKMPRSSYQRAVRNWSRKGLDNKLEYAGKGYYDKYLSECQVRLTNATDIGGGITTGVALQHLCYMQLVLSRQRKPWASAFFGGVLEYHSGNVPTLTEAARSSVEKDRYDGETQIWFLLHYNCGGQGCRHFQSALIDFGERTCEIFDGNATIGGRGTSGWNPPGPAQNGSSPDCVYVELINTISSLWDVWTVGSAILILACSIESGQRHRVALCVFSFHCGRSQQKTDER